MLNLIQHLVMILEMSSLREEPPQEAPLWVFLLLHLNIGRVEFLGAGYDHALNLF